jgi:glycosidase
LVSGYDNSKGYLKYNDGIYPGNVEEQLANPNSILNYLKIATRLRYKYPAIARGRQSLISFEESNEYAILVKDYNNEKLYILINLSNDVENVNLNDDLSSLVVLDTLSINGVASKKVKKLLEVQPYSITILK